MYPELHDRENGTMAGLDELCRKHRGIDGASEGRLRRFGWEFSVFAGKLQKAPSILSNRDACKTYLETLDGVFRVRVQDAIFRRTAVLAALELSSSEQPHPKRRRKEDPISLSIVIRVAELVARQITTCPKENPVKDMIILQPLVHSPPRGRAQTKRAHQLGVAQRDATEMGRMDSHGLVSVFAGSVEEPVIDGDETAVGRPEQRLVEDPRHAGMSAVDGRLASVQKTIGGRRNERPESSSRFWDDLSSPSNQNAHGILRNVPSECIGNAGDKSALHSQSGMMQHAGPELLVGAMENGLKALHEEFLDKLGELRDELLSIRVAFRASGPTDRAQNSELKMFNHDLGCLGDRTSRLEEALEDVRERMLDEFGLLRDELRTVQTRGRMAEELRTAADARVESEMANIRDIVAEVQNEALDTVSMLRDEFLSFKTRLGTASCPGHEAPNSGSAALLQNWMRAEREFEKPIGAKGPSVFLPLLTKKQRVALERAERKEPGDVSKKPRRGKGRGRAGLLRKPEIGGGNRAKDLGGPYASESVGSVMDMPDNVAREPGNASVDLLGVYFFDEDSEDGADTEG
uniref:Uncharacterized protein n=1 Tax=Mycena chlorophos TaxID=658473 RepID=A0ABQ0LFI7_MYCCL|nr:predicted protein [Mycena chlorophos]